MAKQLLANAFVCIVMIIDINNEMSIWPGPEVYKREIQVKIDEINATCQITLTEPNSSNTMLMRTHFDGRPAIMEKLDEFKSHFNAFT